MARGQSSPDDLNWCDELGPGEGNGPPRLNLIFYCEECGLAVDAVVKEVLQFSGSWSLYDAFNALRLEPLLVSSEAKRARA